MEIFVSSKFNKNATFARCDRYLSYCMTKKQIMNLPHFRIYCLRIDIDNSPINETEKNFINDLINADIYANTLKVKDEMGVMRYSSSGISNYFFNEVNARNNVVEYVKENEDNVQFNFVKKVPWKK